MDYEEAKWYSARRKGSKKQWTYQYHNATEVFLVDESSNRSLYVPRKRFEKDWELVK